MKYNLNGMKKKDALKPLKVLVVFSDGRLFEGESELVRDSMNAIKQSGVTVVALYVNKQNVLNEWTFHSHPEDNWDSGAQTMFDIASEVSPTSVLGKFLKDTNWKVTQGSRLLLQADHSGVLRELTKK